VRYSRLDFFLHLCRRSIPPIAARAGETDIYSSVFDLTTTRSLSSADRDLLHLIDVDELASSSSSGGLYTSLYERVETLITDGGFR
jgi:elongator complex protein 4